MEKIRTELFLGNNKIIVGDKYSDLVLETLGKIYIKSGNSSRLLSDVLKSLDDTNQDINNVFTLNTITQLENYEYPGDGKFIYIKDTKSLYITSENKYILLISPNTEDTYVKRTGDIMTGTLNIMTQEVPLIISSNKLVKNLNSEFVNNYSSDKIAIKENNEFISGNWRFGKDGISEGNWDFKHNINVRGDTIISNNIKSPTFMPGFNGYGWLLDTATNTLTIDNLIIRKALKVYELVANQIYAVNGNLWVSNSNKCSEAIQPILISKLQLEDVDNLKLDIQELFNSDSYYLFYDLPINRNDTSVMTTELTDTNGSYIPKLFSTLEFLIRINNLDIIINNPIFKNTSSLYDSSILDITWENYHANNPDIKYEDFVNYRSNIKLIYIYKSRKILKWSEELPSSWIYVDNFNLFFPFDIIPKDRESDFKKGGLFSKGNPNTNSMKPYFKYFGLPTDLLNSKQSNIWIVTFKDLKYPCFRPGDIVRCQKLVSGNIKYYDAIVMSQIDSYSYVFQKSLWMNDLYSNLEYSGQGDVKYIETSNNNKLYELTELSYDFQTNSYKPVYEYVNRIDSINKGDNIVLIGNILYINRQNSIYLTSTDDNSPFIDILSGINRPDFSVIYITPKWAIKQANVSKINDKYIKLGYSNFYYLNTSPGSVSPDNPQVLFLKNNGDTLIDSEITNEILENPTKFGVFITEVPTSESVIVKENGEYQCNYTDTIKVRLGNLSSIHNTIFKTKQPHDFGLYSDNVFLTGEFYLNNGKSVVDYSLEGLLLKFKNAGLNIEKIPKLDAMGKPIVDDFGNIIYEKVQLVDLNGKPEVGQDGKPIMIDKTQIILKSGMVGGFAISNNILKWDLQICNIGISTLGSYISYFGKLRTSLVKVNTGKNMDSLGIASFSLIGSAIYGSSKKEETSIYPNTNAKSFAGFFDGTVATTDKFIGRYWASKDNEPPGDITKGYSGVSFTTNLNLNSVTLNVRDGLIVGVLKDGKLLKEEKDLLGRYWVNGIPSLAPTKIESIVLERTNVTIYKDELMNLKATIKPEISINVPLNWVTDNDCVKVYSNGDVLGIKLGLATVTAYIGNTEASCKVIVNEN